MCRVSLPFRGNTTAGISLKMPEDLQPITAELIPKALSSFQKNRAVQNVRTQLPVPTKLPI